MYPCSSCSRHLREAEPVCPFCGQEQRTTRSSTLSSIGAFALVATMLGTSACAKNPTSSTDSQTTTTSGSTSDDSTSSTTTDESTDTSESDVTTGDDSITDTQDTSLSFYAGPDNDLVQGTDCDPFSQDCPEGEKCVPRAELGPWWDDSECVPVLGDGAPGEPCTYDGPSEATDSCDADSLCWNVQDVNGTPTGVCTAFCMGTPDDPICEPSLQCMVANEGMVSNEGMVTLCMPPCDPLALDSCPAGQACAWVTNGFFCNVPLAAGMQGDACAYEPTDCSPGLQCVGSELLPNCADASCCTSYCDVTAQTDPCLDLGLQCISMFELGMAPPGHEDVGYCGLPA